ncbi:hypothetical protein L1887_58576 [Cichorium endivia]|nr:hypothetical protein L1887_58576 [Cichorium endivia]
MAAMMMAEIRMKTLMKIESSRPTAESTSRIDSWSAIRSRWILSSDGVGEAVDDVVDDQLGLARRAEAVPDPSGERLRLLARVEGRGDHRAGVPGLKHSLSGDLAGDGAKHTGALERHVAHLCARLAQTGTCEMKPRGFPFGFLLGSHVRVFAVEVLGILVEGGEHLDVELGRLDAVLVRDAVKVVGDALDEELFGEEDGGTEANAEPESVAGEHDVACGWPRALIVGVDVGGARGRGGRRASRGRVAGCQGGCLDGCLVCALEVADDDGEPERKEQDGPEKEGNVLFGDDEELGVSSHLLVEVSDGPSEDAGDHDGANTAGPPADPDGAEPDGPPEDADVEHLGVAELVGGSGIVDEEGKDAWDPEEGGGDEDVEEQADGGVSELRARAMLAVETDKASVGVVLRVACTLEKTLPGVAVLALEAWSLGHGRGLCLVGASLEAPRHVGRVRELLRVSRGGASLSGRIDVGGVGASVVVRGRADALGGEGGVVGANGVVKCSIVVRASAACSRWWSGTARHASPRRRHGVYVIRVSTGSSGVELMGSNARIVEAGALPECLGMWRTAACKRGPHAAAASQLSLALAADAEKERLVLKPRNPADATDRGIRRNSRGTAQVLVKKSNSHTISLKPQGHALQREKGAGQRDDCEDEPLICSSTSWRGGIAEVQT